MSTEAIDLADIKSRMDGSLSALKQELSGLRTGRASASLLDPIMVEAYGQSMPINQLATVSTPEARLIAVQVWDQGLVGAVEKAIRESSLGLNPSAEGANIRIALPEINEERRKELAKVAHRYAEQARVSIRHVRRDGMEAVKKAEKDGKISQDEAHSLSDKVQEATDEFVKLADEALSAKETEIMRV